MQDLAQWADGLEQQARDKIIAFWLEHGIDKECGGYWTDLARDGSRYGQGEKWIVVQARTIYSFCLAYQFFGEQIYLDQAAQGVAFFREHFRDPKNGGWYYCVSRDGSEVLDPSKQPYGLSFVSYGFAEYGRLTGDRAVLQEAIDTHELVMEKCWDREHGGLPNRFTPDWQLVEGIKRVDTHMHTMEGVSAIYHATGDGHFLERLEQLAGVILGDIGRNGCYDALHGCTHEQFHMDWTEALERTQGLVNYGHVTEAGWFIAKLAAYTGDTRQYRLAKGLVDWAIQHGFDTERGGLFDYGRPTGEVVRDVKTWWNQAELLGALAFLYRMTGERAYRQLLGEHIAFIERNVLDAEYGEWYPQLKADGSIARDAEGLLRDHKGNRFKSPYHVMQGLYHACHDLRRAAGVKPVAEPKSWADYCL
ncbi:MAG: AGE family epimerase/isomerase [Chloroflexi bacterium]|nr:AGE family epimerase/isomerase [Chloroflexota bacterium]